MSMMMRSSPASVPSAPDLKRSGDGNVSRLSSGQRVNTASDDPMGLGIGDLDKTGGPARPRGNVNLMGTSGVSRYREVVRMAAGSSSSDEGTIRSQSIALETANLAQNQIKTQEGVEKLSEANSEPQKALRLL